MQAFQGRDAKGKVVENAEEYNLKGVLFQPHYPRTVLHGSAMQQHTESNSINLRCPQLHRPAPPQWVK
jgi:hypothetical protein